MATGIRSGGWLTDATVAQRRSRCVRHPGRAEQAGLFTGAVGCHRRGCRRWLRRRGVVWGEYVEAAIVAAEGIGVEADRMLPTDVLMWAPHVMDSHTFGTGHPWDIHSVFSQASQSNNAWFG